jgi:hypothetical protein
MLSRLFSSSCCSCRRQDGLPRFTSRLLPHCLYLAISASLSLASPSCTSPSCTPIVLYLTVFYPHRLVFHLLVFHHLVPHSLYFTSWSFHLFLSLPSLFFHALWLPVSKFEAPAHSLYSHFLPNSSFNLLSHLSSRPTANLIIGQQEYIQCHA